MKKLMAGLFAGLLCMAFVGSAMAQNFPNRYDAYGIGSVNYSMNSGGSYYGQIFNSVSTSSWSLGFGTAQGTSGTGVIYWNSMSAASVGTATPNQANQFQVGTAFSVKNSGWVELKGAAPVASSCGSPSVVTGNDQTGDISIGGGANTTCTITFNNAPSSIPQCFASNRTSKVSVIAQPTLTTLVLVGTTASAPMGAPADVIQYFCIPNQ